MRVCWPFVANIGSQFLYSLVKTEMRFSVPFDTASEIHKYLYICTEIICLTEKKDTFSEMKKILFFICVIFVCIDLMM